MERCVPRWAVVAVLLGVLGCSSADVGLSEAELIPPGSDAAPVSNTIPTSMHPGERLDVTVTMANTGTAGATNTWTISPRTYAFFRNGSPSFGFNYDVLEATTPVGATATQHFVLTAPSTPGTYSFTGQMGIVGDARFGSSLTVPTITVDAATPRRWGCGFVSTGSSIPTTMAPGESRLFTIVVQNTGTEAWSASGFALYSRDTPVGLWNNTIRALTTSVAPGATTTFTVPVTAPSTPGVYQFRRQMLATGANSVGFFDLAESCVDATITVGGTPDYDNAFVSNTLPSTLAPNEARSVTVTVTNTGRLDWPADGTVYLYSANSPPTLYGVTIDQLTAPVPVGTDHTFTFTIRAPSAPGMYSQAWRMRTAAGFFGPLLSVPLTVDGAATPSLDAAVATQTVPTLVTAGETATFSITMQNTGTASWTGSSIGLYSTNTPVGLWGATGQFLGAGETVAAGSSRTFAFNVTAPAAAGTYESRWRMLESPGAGFFGAEAVTSTITVTLCGNGTVDPGEQCDDDNLTAGDGCSSACGAEVVEYDLLTDAADRTLLGTMTNRQLGNVTLGDVTGDSVVDVVVAEGANVVPATGTTRVLAGTVYGYTTGAAFFTSTSTTLPADATFRILGASTSDSLGITASGGLATGDVTGDGTGDLVVSAGLADGDGDARVDAGEVYVLRGGAGLTGDIDLGAAEAPAALVARIIGAGAGDRLVVLDVRDLTGDSTADLVLGAPLADTPAGADSGAVYVVAGGAALTGTIDLAAPGAATVHRITGPSLDARIGGAAAAGDYFGSATADLLIGNQRYSLPGRSRTGAVWGIVGPITSDISLAAPVGSAGGPTFQWIGETQNDLLGTSVEIGNVAGSTAGDVVIGAIQQRRSGAQVGAVNVWDGASLVAGTTYNLAAAASQTAVFLGADQFDNAGSSLALGDMNGDGYLDVPVVSSIADGPGNTRSNAGEMVVYLGAPTLTGIIDLGLVPGSLVVYGAAASDLLGIHVGNIAYGDVDGDGLDDLCVGSYQGGAGHEGRVDCFQSTF